MAAIAREDQQKRVVQVKRVDLLATLKGNKEKHIAEFKAAVLGYRKEAMARLNESHESAKQKLERSINKAREWIDSFDEAKAKGASDYFTLVDSQNIHLKVPRCYAEEYEAAIAMAEWDTRDILELSHAEFTCFVRDKWDWTDDFFNSTSAYNK